MKIDVIHLQNLNRYKIVIFCVFLFLFGNGEVHAQQFATMLSPAQSHIIAKPGAEIIIPYTLTNTGDPVVIKLRVYGLAITDSKGSYELIPVDPSPSGTELPHFSTSDPILTLDSPFLVSSQEAVEFDLVIRTNEDIKEHDYYFSLVAEAEPAEGFEDTSRIILQNGIGSAIYLSLSADGNLDIDGEIALFEVRPQYSFQLLNHRIAFIDSFQPIPIILTVANTGDRIFPVSGQISVKSQQKAETIVIPIANQYILANSQRLLTSQPSDNQLQADSVTTALLPGSFMGLYQAQTYIRVGHNPDQLTAATNYVIFPFRYMTIGLIVFLLPLSAYIIIRYVKN